MREILFRGKRIDNGEWVDGDLVQLHDGRRFIINNRHGYCVDDKGNFINTEAPFVCEVGSETVGQFTGLTDKNGKKIFEGDVFAHPDKPKYKYVVECKDGGFGIFMYDSGFDAGRIEVIGNIHDNPKLIRRTENG